MTSRPSHPGILQTRPKIDAVRLLVAYYIHARSLTGRELSRLIARSRGYTLSSNQVSRLRLRARMELGVVIPVASSASWLVAIFDTGDRLTQILAIHCIYVVSAPAPFL